MPELELEPSGQELDANLAQMRETVYIGRFVITGMAGGKVYQIGGLTGRGDDSRARGYAREYDGTRTVAPGKTQEEMQEIKDAPLIYYKATKECGGVHIASNGAQTEPLTFYILGGFSFRNSLRILPVVDDKDLSSYEPDRLKTPRISSMVDIREKALAQFGLATVFKEPKYDSTVTNLSEASFEELPDGVGYCVQTYVGEENDPRSFDEIPYPLPLRETIEENSELYLQSLHPKNLVAFYVKQINLNTGKVEYSIHNDLLKPEAA